MNQLQILRCAECDWASFPDRLRCPGCGAQTFRRIPSGPGLVEEETTVRRTGDGGEPVRIGSVRLDAGPMLVARLDTDVEAGARVTIGQTADRAIWAVSGTESAPAEN